MGAGPAATDAGQARKRMFSPAKTYASEPPARQAPMIHGIESWLCSGRSSMRFGSFASFGEADVCRVPKCPTALNVRQILFFSKIVILVTKININSKISKYFKK